jgi:ribosomal protein L37AE/L43A
MMEKACPACAARMIDGPESRGAWACTACGGVWAGVGVSNRVASILARWKPDTGAEVAADVALGALGVFFSILTD